MTYLPLVAESAHTIRPDIALIEKFSKPTLVNSQAQGRPFGLAENNTRSHDFSGVIL
jgi:hypothetical protein